MKTEQQLLDAIMWCESTRKALSDKAKEVERIEKETRDELLTMMKTDGVVKQTIGHFTVSLAMRGGGVDVTDIEAVPAEFVRVKTTKEPDKVAIAAYIKNGLGMPNWAIMKEPVEVLTIKAKG